MREESGSRIRAECRNQNQNPESQVGAWGVRFDISGRVQKPESESRIPGLVRAESGRLDGSGRMQKPELESRIPGLVRGESGSGVRAECRNQNQNPEYQGWCVRSPARELGLSTEPTQNQNPEYLEGLSW